MGAVTVGKGSGYARPRVAVTVGKGSGYARLGLCHPVQEYFAIERIEDSRKPWMGSIG